MTRTLEDPAGMSILAGRDGFLDRLVLPDSAHRHGQASEEADDRGDQEDRSGPPAADVAGSLTVSVCGSVGSAVAVASTATMTTWRALPPTAGLAAEPTAGAL